MNNKLNDQEHLQVVAFFITEETGMQYQCEPFSDDNGMGIQDTLSGAVIAYGVDRKSFNNAYTEFLHAENGTDCDVF